jgi:hypothetical protein
MQPTLHTIQLGLAEGLVKERNSPLSLRLFMAACQPVATDLIPTIPIL